MSYVIALAGKGGTGKTTVAALLVRLIKEKNLGSILAVDADPNSNLAESLGVLAGETIAGVLDGLSRNPESVPAGTPKDRFIEYKIQTIVQEAGGFDLLTMGKPEGPGCYCYVNNVLRNIMAKLIKEYDYIIIDNEAGFEHLSRRTTREADALLVISDATTAGLRAAQRINELAQDLEIKIKNRFLLVNRCDKGIDRDEISDMGLDYIGSIPPDARIEQASANGNSMLKLASSAASIIALGRLGERIWGCN